MRAPGIPLGTTMLLAGAALAGALALVLAFPTDKLVGEMFEADGEFDEAIRYLRAWADAHPSDLQARWHAADLYLKTVQPERGIEVVEAIARERPHDPRPLERLVRMEESLFRTERVLPHLQAWAELEPRSVEVQRRLADHYRWFGETEALVRTLERLVALGHFPELDAELIDILLSTGDAAAVVRIFEPEAARRPGALEVQLGLHEAYRRLDRRAEATAALDAIARLAPVEPEGLRAVAAQLTKYDRFPEAIALYERLVARPEHAQAIARDLSELHRAYALRLIELGRPREAVLLYDALIERSPDDLGLRLELADLFGEEANSIAIDELEEYVARTPTSVLAWRALGDRRAWEGRPAAAAEAYRRALALKPGDLALERRVLEEEIAAGRHDEALRSARRIFERTKNAEDRARYVELLLDQQALPEALRVAEAWVLESPDDPRARAIAVDVASALNDCGRAVPHLAWQASKTPSADLYGRLGLCLRELGREAEALDALVEARRLRGALRGAGGGER